MGGAIDDARKTAAEPAAQRADALYAAAAARLRRADAVLHRRERPHVRPERRNDAVLAERSSLCRRCDGGRAGRPRHPLLVQPGKVRRHPLQRAARALLRPDRRHDGEQPHRRAIHRLAHRSQRHGVLPHHGARQDIRPQIFQHENRLRLSAAHPRRQRRAFGRILHRRGDRPHSEALRAVRARARGGGVGAARNAPAGRYAHAARRSDGLSAAPRGGGSGAHAAALHA